MKRKKMNIIRRAGICGALAAALTAGLAGCGAKESAGTAGTEPASASDSRAAGGEETRIAAGADGFQIEGDGASVSGNTVTISRAGTYRLSGDMADGNLLVNAEENDEIRLVFDGFSIASADIAPIYVSQCGSVTVETAAGTENSVTDGRTYEKTEDDESPDAAIFSECDLILEGEGTLAVSGQFQEGIRGKDDVTVASGTIRIEALNDGLKGKDAVYIEGGTLEITAGDDGIQSDNEKDSDKGFVTVSGGTVTIDAVGKGIQGESRVDISGGYVSVVNSEEGIEALVIEISGGEVDICLLYTSVDCPAGISRGAEKYFHGQVKRERLQPPQICKAHKKAPARGCAGGQIHRPAGAQLRGDPGAVAGDHQGKAGGHRGHRYAASGHPADRAGSDGDVCG